MKRLIFTLISLATVIIASSQSEPDWQKKVSPSLLDKVSRDQSAPFIILLKQQANVNEAKWLNSKNEKAFYVFNTLRDEAIKSQKNLKSYLEQRNIPYQSLFIVNAIRAKGNMDLLHSLALRNDVGKILEDEAIHYPEPFNARDDPEGSRQTIEWGIERINADDVWALGFSGQGAVVGGEDTGYDWDHPALIRQYRGYNEVADTADHNYNWHDAIHEINPLNADSINPCGLNSLVPCDDRAHGTHTMGTMVGLDSANQIGVAPEAKWCGCRNMERGWGSPFTYLECFQWFLGPTDLNNENPDPSKSPHVINNSWGCPKIEGCDSSNYELLNLAVNNLKLAGIVVVVSAGNSGSGCGSVSVPAAMYEGSFSVGATAINDTIAGFSSRGPVVVDSSFRLKPNVSAPGVSVRSCVPGDGYASFSGTSMAGPHVAGLIALMISANPDIAGHVDTIESIIERTAVPKTTDQQCGDIPGSQVPNNTYGFGRVDALAAVQEALKFIPVSTKDQPDEMRVNIYPNPMSDQLILSFPDGIGDIKLDLFDVNGKILFVKKGNITSNKIIQLDVTEIPSGIYFLRIASDSEIAQSKIIKH